MGIEPKAFRDLMGTFATGVTVVATSNDGFLHGMTANAVTSLSLDPTLLLVCVDKGAFTHEQLSACSSFSVNILTADQEAVSTLFAKHEPPERDRLRGAAYRIGETGAPILEGVSAWVECRKTDALEGGDHTIFVGEAIAGSVASDAPPLLFHRGRYARLA